MQGRELWAAAGPRLLMPARTRTRTHHHRAWQVAEDKTFGLKGKNKSKA